MFEVRDVSRDTLESVRSPIGAGEKVGIVVHTTDGRESLKWLQGASAAAGSPASADALIHRNGTIFWLMPKGYYAWHAGKVTERPMYPAGQLWSGNTYGIELENYDRAGELPTEAQHRALAGLMLHLAHYEKYNDLTITGHYAIARPIGRRSDPTGLNWGHVFWLMQFGKDKCRLSGALSAIGV